MKRFQPVSKWNEWYWGWLCRYGLHVVFVGGFVMEVLFWSEYCPAADEGDFFLRGIRVLILKLEDVA